DQDIDEQPKRKKKAAGSGSGIGRKLLFATIALFFGIGFGVAVGYVGPYLYFKPPDSGKSSVPTSADDLLYMPNDCKILASINVKKCLNSNSFKNFQTATGLKDSDVEKITKRIGVAPYEIERVTFGSAGIDDYKSAVAVARLSKGITAA